MDTTEQDILMCEKAEEIQKLWKPARGDFYRSKVYSNLLIVTNLTSGPSRKPSAFIWLPRQDQLQDMLDETHGFSAKIFEFFEFYSPESNCPDEEVCQDCANLGKFNRMTYISMEQLWLAFVMYELYQKKWNGVDWIKDNDN